MKNIRVYKALVVAMATAACSLSAVAEQRAPVDELEVPSRGANVAAQGSVTKMSATPQTDMYYQLQVLQEEVRQLRGSLEEASYEILQLKQRQMDDYLDLDRRVSLLQSGTVSTAPPVAVADPGLPSVSPSTSPAQIPALKVSDDIEKDEYSAAYLLLREKKIPESIAAFNAYAARYPNGTYVSNAYYWLGETNALTGDLAQAEKAFSVVVDKFPLSRKSEDATLGLAKVYFRKGKKARARVLLEKVSAGTSRTATKAKAFLQENF